MTGPTTADIDCELRLPPDVVTRVIMQRRDGSLLKTLCDGSDCTFSASDSGLVAGRKYQYSLTIHLITGRSVSADITEIQA